jgi:hypothetical protein
MYSANDDQIAAKCQVTRVSPSEELLKNSVSQFEHTILAKAERERVFSEHIAQTFAPSHKLIHQDPQAAASFQALDRLVKDDHQLHLEADHKFHEPSLPETFNFTVGPAGRFITPPYDLQWTTPEAPSVGATRADKLTGALHCQLISGGRWDRTAAVGVFLSTPIRSFVRLTPFGRINFRWQQWSVTPGGSNGGVGVVVYTNANPNPTLVRHANVWSEWQPNPVSGVGASGVSNFEGALLGGVTILMEPGNTYQFWMMYWTNRSTPNVYTTITGGVPFLLVEPA